MFINFFFIVRSDDFSACKNQEIDSLLEQKIPSYCSSVSSASSSPSLDESLKKPHHNKIFSYLQTTRSGCIKTKENATKSSLPERYNNHQNDYLSEVSESSSESISPVKSRYI